MNFISLLLVFDYLALSGSWPPSARPTCGQASPLAGSEAGRYRRAQVRSVEACPPEAAGPIAGLVTGTFQTEKATLVSVYVDSLTEPIGATASHPFFSVDRNAWVGAGDLQGGERVRRPNGFDSAAERRQSRSPRREPWDVAKARVSSPGWGERAPRTVTASCVLPPLRGCQSQPTIVPRLTPWAGLFCPSGASGRTTLRLTFPDIAHEVSRCP